MAELAAQKADADGLDLTLAAASAGGDTYTNGRTRSLVVDNGDASSVTVTVASVVASPAPGTAAADLVLTVPASTRLYFAPLASSGYGSTVSLAYSGTTSLTVGVLEI